MHSCYKLIILIDNKIRRISIMYIGEDQRVDIIQRTLFTCEISNIPTTLVLF